MWVCLYTLDCNTLQRSSMSLEGIFGGPGLVFDEISGIDWYVIFGFHHHPLVIRRRKNVFFDHHTHRHNIGRGGKAMTVLQYRLINTESP